MTTKRKLTKWTIESFSDHVWHMYNRTIYVIPGQVYTNNHTKLWFYCTTHGYYDARPRHVLNEKMGSQCPGCKADKNKARRDAITAAFVGQTTADGLKILEHVGYQQPPAYKANGWIGQAVYRYLCPHCGNDRATATGCHLKQPGNTTHCGCLGKRDSVQKFQRNPKHRDADCYLYVFNTIAATGLKIGIAKNIKSRITTSYGDQLFTIFLKRSDAWAVEQCLHYLLRGIGFQYELDEVPAWLDKEGGGTEVFSLVSMKWLLQQIKQLSSEVLECGFTELLDRYIPIEDQNALQLTRWDGKRMHHSTGDGFIGFNFEQTFKDMFDGKITNN